MARLPPINRRPFTSPNAGRPTPISSERCEEAAGGGTVARARKLRRNANEAEQHLWLALKLLKFVGFHFRRQAPVGNYFPDFVCHRSKLVIELDGSQHADGAAVTYDAQRTAYLNSRGYRVHRFWNCDVLQNRDGVVQIIIAKAKAPHPPGFAGRPPRVGGSPVSTGRDDSEVRCLLSSPHYTAVLALVDKHRADSFSALMRNAFCIT